MVPLSYPSDISAKAGDTISVEGVLMDTAGSSTTELCLRVAKVVIGGKTYDVPIWGRMGGKGSWGWFDGGRYGPHDMRGRGRW